ncbi:hypothetical protein GS506_17675 [Rhodococcus hoagii]|nr:hypothetical protein [Prescottella equi]
MARFRASKAAPATTSSAEAANRAIERVPFTPPRKAVSRPDSVEMVVDSIVREMIPSPVLTIDSTGCSSGCRSVPVTRRWALRRCGPRLHCVAVCRRERGALRWW